MKTLKDKVVLITGAGRGSGRVLALAFARHGSLVAANDVSPVNVDEVVSLAVREGGRARAYVDDIAKKVAVQSILRQVEDDFGPPDVVIQQASVEPHVALLDMDEWDWHRTLEVNLSAAFLMTQSAGRMMRARGSGVIIHLIPPSEPRTAGTAAFAASMSGLRGFVQQAERELGPYGIQVHAVEDAPATVVQSVFSRLDLQQEDR